MTEYYSVVCMYIHNTSQLLYSSVRGPLDCIRILIIDNAAVIIRVQVFLWCFILISHRNFVFNFVRTFHNILHSGCTNLYPHQQWKIFHFLHIVTNMYILFFDHSCLNKCKVISHCILICILLIPLLFCF